MDFESFERERLKLLIFARGKVILVRADEG
jgi:hypothetical protein